MTITISQEFLKEIEELNLSVKKVLHAAKKKKGMLAVKQYQNQNKKSDAKSAVQDKISPIHQEKSKIFLLLISTNCVKIRLHSCIF